MATNELLSSADEVSVDVLIIGAGPAGFMSALTLARYGISFRLIDGRPTRIQTGHAGGVQPRTQEVLQTLNLHHRLDVQGNHVSETAFWSSGDSGKLERTHIGGEIQNPTRFPWILSIPQRETERAFDEDLNARGHVVDRPTELLNFYYTEDPEYPVSALVKNKYSNVTSVYRTKYILGSDGATSKTREILGLGSEKHGEDDIWCVADLQLDTNFPDARRRCAIRTLAGGIMLIPNPRDGNRVYTQLKTQDLVKTETHGTNETNGTNGTNGANGHHDHEGSVVVKTTFSDSDLLGLLRERVRAVAAPYTMEIKKLFWISQYRVRQRIVDDFWDHKRVFVLGDACHTHSPKAAQGLNVSFGDAYNLTWKLALVLKGQAFPSLLDTYALERRQIAKQLVDFDAKFSHLFARKDFLDNSTFHDVYDKAHGFTSGVGQRYEPGLLTVDTGYASINKSAIEPLTPGKRLFPMPVTRHIDGSSVDILDEMPSNGRFHLFVFAGNAISRGALAGLCGYLTSGESALTLFNPDVTEKWGFENIHVTSSQNERRVIDMFMIHTDNHYDIDLSKLPLPFPQWSYRIYADKIGDMHKMLGVDVETGAMALVRPDGVISLVVGLDGGRDVTALLQKVLQPRVVG